jgi:hypothetical protein
MPRASGVASRIPTAFDAILKIVRPVHEAGMVFQGHDFRQAIVGRRVEKYLEVG